MYAIIRVGTEHHGDLQPGLMIVLPVSETSVLRGPRCAGATAHFKNPKGGWSWGTILAFTTADQDAQISMDH